MKTEGERNSCSFLLLFSFLVSETQKKMLLSIFQKWLEVVIVLRDNRFNLNEGEKEDKNEKALCEK